MTLAAPTSSNTRRTLKLAALTVGLSLVCIVLIGVSDEEDVQRVYSTVQRLLWLPVLLCMAYLTFGTLRDTLKRAKANARRKRYEKAGEIEDSFTEAIRRDPKDAAAHYRRGEAYAEQEDYDRAIADFSKAIALDADYAMAYHDRGVTHAKRGDHDREIADYNEAIRLDPDSALPYHNRGLAHAHRGDYDRAIADFTEAIRIEPKDAVTYCKRGWAYGKKGDYDREIADYGEAIRRDPDYVPAYYNRAAAYAESGDYKREIADYRQVIRLHKEEDRAHCNLAWVLATCPDERYRSGRTAVKYATGACKRTGWTNPFGLDALAAAYAEAGQFDAAVSWQTKALGMSQPEDYDESAARCRLELYKAGKPYREQ